MTKPIQSQLEFRYRLNKLVKSAENSNVITTKQLTHTLLEIALRNEPQEHIIIPVNDRLHTEWQKRKQLSETPDSTQMLQILLDIYDYHRNEEMA